MYKPLKLSVKENKYKPSALPPNDGSECFSNVIYGTRGQGKSYLLLQFLNTLKQYGYYNVFFLSSATYKSDMKVKNFYDDLEKEGFFLVYRYKKFDENVVKEIQKIMKQHIKEWEKYIKVKSVLDKVRRRQKNFTDEELEIIDEYLGDIEEFEVEELLGIMDEFHPAIKRDTCPTGHWAIDDFFGSPLLTKNQGSNPFTRFYIQHRHKRISVSILVQALTGIPRAIRINTMLWMMFPNKCENQLAVLYEENSGVFDNLDHFKRVMDKIDNDGERNFLYLDSSNTRQPDIRSGFNKKISIDDI